MSDDKGRSMRDLAAIEDIRRLKHTYMQYCDLGYPPDKLGPLFTDDAVWTSEIFGRHEGRSAIETFFGGVSNDIVFAAHLALNPIIEVNGDTATGLWRLWMPCTIMEDGEPVARLMLGEYDEAYRCVDGRWLFTKVDVFMNFNVRAEESWATVASMRP